MLSFLDAFSGYHQIPMDPPDVEKITFITPHGAILLQCDVVWLKECRGNVSEVSDQDVQASTRKKNIEVYIDDMWVKSKERSDHAEHLQEAFELLRAYDMKLNPSKCTFGVSAGRFLGFIVT